MPRSSAPPDQPQLFVDRSLGRHLLPDALREHGFVVHTLASVFGEERGQHVVDEDWIAHAGAKGWVVLTKDDAIRRRPLELAAIERFRVQVFCLTNAGLRGDQQRDRFLANIYRITQRARKPGPWICGVYEDRIAQIWPARPPGQ